MWPFDAPSKRSSAASRDQVRTVQGEIVGEGTPLVAFLVKGDALEASEIIEAQVHYLDDDAPQYEPTEPKEFFLWRCFEAIRKCFVKLNEECLSDPNEQEQRDGFDYCVDAMRSCLSNFDREYYQNASEGILFCTVFCAIPLSVVNVAFCVFVFGACWYCIMAGIGVVIPLLLNALFCAALLCLWTGKCRAERKEVYCFIWVSLAVMTFLALSFTACLEQYSDSGN
ncbi:MAG: hypothetical protein SGILL_008010 [Bacillariaceae sp.]